MKKSRIEIVDALRGIAALSVCWFHLTNTYPAGSPVRLSGQYGWLGVEVFFVISGFIIPFSLHSSGYSLRKHWVTFIARRIIRLDPPFLAAIGLTIFLWHLSSLAPAFRGSAPAYTSTSLLLHLGYLNDIFHAPWLSPVFWTLAIEFQFYLLISLLYPVFCLESGLKRWAVLILFCSIPFIFPSRAFVSGYLCLFALGILSFQYYSGLISRLEFLVLFVGIAVLCLLGLGIQATLVATLTSLTLAFLKIRCCSALIYLGVISYSLYLIHVPIGGRVVNIFRRVAISDFELFCTSVVALAVSLIAAWIFYELIERPAHRWAARLAFRDTSTIKIKRCKQ